MPPAYEVLLLNTAIPQIQAAQSGDTYVVPRDIAFSAALTLSAGTANGVAYLNGSKVLTSGSALTFDGTNLGLGTSTPTGAGGRVFEVYSSGSISEVHLTNSTSGNTGLRGLTHLLNGVDAYAYNRENGAYIFGVNNSEGMRLTSTGLGIGTSSITDKLTAQGTIRATDGTNYAQFANNFLRSYASGTFYFDNATVGQSFVYRVSGASSLDTTALTLNSSGNLGLGVTPSAWSGITALQVKNASISSVSGNNSEFNSNLFYDGSNYKYISSGYATAYQQYNGTHKWVTAPSWNGTGSDTASLTQAMTLDASGNLAIGTQNPNAYSSTTTFTINGTTYSEIDFEVGGTLQGYINGVSGGLEITADGSRFIKFRTDNTERARITSGGEFLVGTQTNTNSSKVFVLATATNPAFASQGVTGDVNTPTALFGKFDNDTTTSQIFVRFTINNNGAGSGQITANGANTAAFGSYSDQRLKENIVDLPPQLANIMSLRPVEFDYIQSEGGGHQIGFIAQNMESVYPDVVGERADGMKMIAGWSKTEARLVKAIQEQQAMINELKAEVAALKGA